MSIDRVVLIVLESLGTGETLPAADDDGRHSGPALARQGSRLRLPNLEKLGLGNVSAIEGIARIGATQGAYGQLTRQSPGRDAATGHWELLGLELEQALPDPPDPDPLWPPRPTVLDALGAQQIPVAGVGLVNDFFADYGGAERISSHGNTDSMIKMVEALARNDSGLLMTYLNRSDPRYGAGGEDDPRLLEEFDIQLAMLLSRASDRDLVLITAHRSAGRQRTGTPPATERVPILVAGSAKAAGVQLGIRQSFADVGATIAEIFAVEAPPDGTSFLEEIS